jgi:hypothetical protein
MKFAEEEIINGEAWAIALISVFAFFSILNLIIIGCQKPSDAKLFFRVR